MSDRRLSTLDATLLVMGGVVGVGIFFTPHAVARLLPEPWPYFAAWALGGLIGLAGALTFAELAATFPHAGGWYVFLREAFGRLPAFLFAWIVLFVVSTGASAVIADFCAAQLALLLWPGAPAPPGAHAALGAGLIVAITAVALRGVRSGALLQDACMLLKLGALLAFAGAAFLAFEPPAAAAPPAPAAWDAGDFARALLPVLFACGGWQFVTYLAPSVRDPQRTLPRVLVGGMAGVVALYLLVNAAFVRVAGLPGLASDPNFAAGVARSTLGDVGGALLVAAMAISSLGVCTAILIASPWVYVAMARDGLFFRALGGVSPRGAPTAALLLQGALALAWFAWGRATVVTDAVVFAEWIFHAQCGLALLLLRRRRPELPRPFRSPLYPLFPALYALLAAALVLATLVSTPGDEVLLGLGVLGAGLLAWPAWRRLAGGAR